jgi:hypothetical protein
LTRIDVAPAVATLIPDSTIQLNIKAWDQFGGAMVDSAPGSADGPWAGRIRYSSSDPRIVDVNSRGVVKGIAPGVADITSTLSVGGVARAATTRVTVPGQAGFPPGEYDLVALITMFDPAWGDFTGYTYKGLLKIPADRIGGTWENFRGTDASGQEVGMIGGGTINSYTDYAGRQIDELVSPNFHLSLGSPVVDPPDSRLVTGQWGCCGHIAGTFTARRR